VPKQAPEEPEEDRGSEAAPEHHEGQLPPVGDGRDDVAPEALPRPRDHRGLPLPPVGGAGLVVGAKPHLIAPVDQGPGLLRGPAEGRVLLGQPPAHRRRVLLEGPAPGRLRREAPALEVPADGPDRDVQPDLLGQELLDGLSGPEGEGQAELVGTAAHDQPDDQRRLMRRQAWSRGPATPLRLERPAPSGLPGLPPFPDGLTGHAEDLGGFRVRHPGPHRRDGAFPQRFLGGGRERAGIGEFHARKTTTAHLDQDDKKY